MLSRGRTVNAFDPTGGTTGGAEEMLARSRLYALLALALVLLLVAATGLLLGSAKPLVGATASAAAYSSWDDDQGGGAVAIASQPLIVAMLLFALVLGVVRRASPSGAVSESCRARSPPPR